MYLAKIKYVYVIVVCMICIGCAAIFSTTLQAQNLTRDWHNAFTLLDDVARETNAWTRIQETALNDISNIQWQYASEFKIANTLDSIRMQISPYLQWIMYLWLSWAVIGLIYNGFMLVTSPVWWEDNANIKTRITNIIKGVIVLTGFYVIIKLMLVAIDYVLT